MTWKNYCIVKLDTGEFAIRKGWFIYRYLDLISPHFWWERCDSDCRTKEENKIKTIFNRLINKNKKTIVFKP